MASIAHMKDTHSSVQYKRDFTSGGRKIPRNSFSMGSRAALEVACELHSTLRKTGTQHDTHTCVLTDTTAK